MPTKAMLMAAGLGTRLRPFSLVTPKPLIPVMGTPCSRFALHSLRDAGVQDVVANVHHLPEVARTGLREIDPGIHFSDESDRILGSGGGIRNALPILERIEGSGSFFIVNADTLSGVSYRELAATHERLRAKHGVIITLALLKSQGTSEQQYSEILIDPEGERMSAIGEASTTGLMYSGSAVLEPEAVASLPLGSSADFVRDILLPAVQSYRVGVHVFSAPWLDIGSPRLWWNAHLQLMQRYEDGTLPESWGVLMERYCRRVDRGIWVSRGVSVQKNARWSARSFWDGAGEAPAALGPDAVLYGGWSGPDVLARGLCADGVRYDFE